MNRIVTIMLLLTLAVVGLGAAEELVAPTLDFSSWQAIIASVLGLLVAWGFKLLRSKWKVETEHEELDSTKSLWEQRNFLIDNRVIPFALSTAEHWLATQLPAMLRDTDFDWSKHWGGLRLYVRSRVIRKFASENLDILSFLTEHELENLIDRMLVRVVATLPPSVTAFLSETAIEKVKGAAASFVSDRATDLLGLNAP